MRASTHPYVPATVYGHPISQGLAAAIAITFIVLVAIGLVRLLRNARS